MITDDFSISFDRHDARLGCAIHYGHHSAPIKTTSNHIDAVNRDELRLPTADYALVVLAPVQHGTQPVEHVILSCGTSCCSKGVTFVAREAAREVLAYITISNFLGAIHKYLSTIVQLWDTVDGK